MSAIATWVCPCCGAERAGQQLDIEAMARQLPPILATIVRALSDRQMTYQELAWAVYRGREPGNATNVLKSTVASQRDRLRPFGWEIVMPGRGRRSASLYLRPLTASTPKITDPRTSSRADSGPVPSFLGRAAPKNSVSGLSSRVGPEPGQGDAVIPGSRFGERTTAGGAAGPSAGFSVPWGQEGFANG